MESVRLASLQESSHKLASYYNMSVPHSVAVASGRVQLHAAKPGTIVAVARALELAGRDRRRGDHVLLHHCRVGQRVGGLVQLPT